MRIYRIAISIANAQPDTLKAYFFRDTVKVNDNYYTIDPQNPYNCFSDLFVSSITDNKQIDNNIKNLEIRTQLLLQYLKNKQEYPNEKDLGSNSLEEMLHSVEPIDHEDRLSLLELIALETQVNITDWLQEQIKANQSENIESVSNIIKHIFKNEKIIELLSQNEIDRIFDIFILSKENKNLVQTNSLSVCIQEAIKKITEKSWNKEQKRQINLIKGILNVLEEKIRLYNLQIKIMYVNSAYTSQTCPNCYYVAKENRDSQNGKFRCCHCGFTADDDVRYHELTKVVGRKYLPSEDDYVAAYNIADRSSILPHSLKLRKDKIKDLMMTIHHEIKGSCKMCLSRH